ncbi:MULTISPECIES: outer membrane protein assembly factor BamE [Marinobacter]|uniref:Outer membrane protein assembly factor BamE n=1 Tax=Marinobacter profundi TaxID=2666256 RepID=A0A2G1UMH2_9GAMM|nr:MULTISPECIES: outer membrane protein assembly factor BamE [Marinobacter]MBD3657925.1 outer membrane protein assembly factor BamE [Marinobacter sp.]PHQ15645.1 cell envelope protein SmpA [Marinobacter profundi]
MQKLTALILTLIMAGCAFPGVYKINVQQGNILTEEELTQLAAGMSRSQVHSVLGTPIMISPVDPSQEYYIYTFQKGGGDIREQRVVVYYENDRYTHHEAELLKETPAY